MNPDQHRIPADMEDDRKPESDQEGLRDHVFDGIQEYDNKMPNWWLLTLYGTVVFSILYWFWFHIFEHGNMPEERLAMQQERIAAIARERGDFEASDLTLFELAHDAGVVASGQNAFASNCAACHGSDGSGGIGPSMISDSWKRGSTPMEIRKAILDGIPAEGMPAWRSILGEARVNEIVAYIIDINPSLDQAAYTIADDTREDG